MRIQLLAGAALIVALGSSGCATEPAAAEKVEPAKVEPIGDTGQNRLVLTAEAVDRLGIRTAKVERAVIARKAQKVVPYASILYDAEGTTFLYTNPEPLIYVRHVIGIRTIEGTRAFLTSGPAIGTIVVTDGAVELQGTEFGIGK